jgi:hypothetical protein
MRSCGRSSSPTRWGDIRGGGGPLAAWGGLEFLCVHYSSGEWVAIALFDVFGAVVGYRVSENARHRYGRTPWGLSSWVWVLIMVVLEPVLGFTLLLSD